MRKQKAGCDRCGDCCMQGGPAIHTQDAGLLEEQKLRLEDLVTVRKGEPAFQPMAQTPEPVENEFLKLQGRTGSWNCKYYDELMARCSIYSYRPVACRVLECSAPEALLTITGKNLLTRYDLIDEDDPIIPYLREHDAACPCPDLGAIADRLKKEEEVESLLAELQELIDRDLAYRNGVSRKFNLSVDRELFYFGRPLFQLLLPLGIVPVQEDETSIRLTLRS